MIYLDKYASSSKLRDLHPLAKFATFIFCLLLALLTKNIAFLFAFAFIVFCTALFVTSNGRRAIIKYASVLVLLVLISTLPLLFERAGDLSSSLIKLPLGFEINSLSLETFVYVSARCLSASLLVLLLILLMPISQILYLMKCARIPVLFIEITELIYRNIFLLLETGEKIMIAQKSRLAYIGFANRYKHFGILISQVFKLSFIRADAQYNGLLSRCYDDQQPAVFFSAGLHKSKCASTSSVVVNNEFSDLMNEGAEKRIISLKNISQKYPDGTCGLKDISLDINAGEKIVVLGKNGSGKSTLFLCLNGIIKPQGGEYVFKGEDISFSRSDLFKLRKEVGLVFQDSNNQLFAPTVYEELAFGMNNLKYSKERIDSTIDSLIDRFGLSVAKDKVPHLLSEGQKKWLCIASVVATSPSVLILDEPTSNLDSKHSDLVMKEMDNLNKMGKTIVISTHDVNMAYEWADRIIVVDDGRIVKDADPLTVFSDEYCLNSLSIKKPFIIDMFDKMDCDKSKACPRTMSEMISLMNTVNCL